MTFKASLFNKGVIVSDLKRFWWVGVLYGLVLLLLLPFHHMMQIISVDNEWVSEALKRSLDIFSGQSGLQALFICTVPVILAVLIFQYLHSVRATGLMHSLPLDRKILFLSHCSSGVVLLLLPVLVTGLTLVVLNMTTTLKDYYSLLNILEWVGLTALIDVLVFAITVFVGMFTGSAAAHIAFTYILQILPTGLNILLAENLRHLVYGYADISTASTATNLKYNFPLLLFTGGISSDYFTAGTVAVYLLGIALFLAAAAYVYKLRHAEAAGEVIAFPILRPVFKYGVTACTMLLAGVYFANAYNGVFPIIVSGYILGSLLGYLTAEALLQKSLKVWSSYRGYLGYVAVVAVLLVGVAIDVTGYEHRVPEPDSVKKVYFGSSLGPWIEVEKNDATATKRSIATIERGGEYMGGSFFEERSNIENIILLHRRLVQERHDTGKEWQKHYIIYLLDNGSYLARQYSIDEKRHASLLRPIYESLEYKQARFPITTQNPTAIKWIEIGDHRANKGTAVLTDRAEIREFVARLMKDVLAATFEEMTADREEYIYADIMIDIGMEKGVVHHYTILPGYSSVISWLKEKGYYEKVVLRPEEIQYVRLERTAPAADNGGLKWVEVRDRRLIEELFLLQGPADSIGPRDAIMATFFGRTAAGPFQYHRTIDRDWPVSEALQKYILKLD